MTPSPKVIPPLQPDFQPAVLAMGSPAGVSQSVTKGIVANTAMISPSGRMVLDGESVGELVRWIGHDAVIFGGNSGGPLVNLRGEIIGVNEVGLGSLGGAIPSYAVSWATPLGALPGKQRHPTPPVPQRQSVPSSS